MAALRYARLSSQQCANPMHCLPLSAICTLDEIDIGGASPLTGAEGVEEGVEIEGISEWPEREDASI